jgi:hypothetical protein
MARIYCDARPRWQAPRLLRKVTNGNTNLQDTKTVYARIGNNINAQWLETIQESGSTADQSACPELGVRMACFFYFLPWRTASSSM